MSEPAANECGGPDGHEWSEWLVDTDMVDTLGDCRELLEEGSRHLQDLVAAVDYLGRGVRPGFTVWDAIEEALRWAIDEHLAATAGAPDPETAIDRQDDVDHLGTQLQHLLAIVDDPRSPRGWKCDEFLQTAIRRWTDAMSQSFNSGFAWPPPLPRGQFPPGQGRGV
jgi:hypothetical protein